MSAQECFWNKVTSRLVGLLSSAICREETESLGMKMGLWLYFLKPYVSATCRKAVKGYSRSKMIVEHSRCVCISCALQPLGASVEEKPDVACPCDANIVISLQFEVASCTSQKLWLSVVTLTWSAPQYVPSLQRWNQERSVTWSRSSSAKVCLSSLLPHCCSRLDFSPSGECFVCRQWEAAFFLDQKMQTDLNLVLSCIPSFPCTGVWVYKLWPVSGIKFFSRLLVSSNPVRNRSLLFQDTNGFHPPYWAMLWEIHCLCDTLTMFHSFHHIL